MMSALSSNTNGDFGNRFGACSKPTRVFQCRCRALRTFSGQGH